MSPAPAQLAVPSPTAAARTLDLPVLGGTRAAWVRARGEPMQGEQGEVFGQDAAVTFSPIPGGAERASRIDLLRVHTAGGDRGGIPVARARELAAPLHPPDTAAVRTFWVDGGQTVEVFRSAMRAAAFGDATRPPPDGGSYFGDEPTGTYIQVAERGGATTNRVVLAVGNSL